MKTRIYFLMFGVFFSYCSFAQNDFDGQGILYSNAAGNAIAIGGVPQGNYGVDARALEVYSPSSTFFNLKSGTNSMWISNHPIYGNYLSAPTNLPFDLRIGFGGQPNIRLQTNGSVSIGSTQLSSDYKLAVGGKVIAEELKVQLQTAWPDYVFASDYQLPSLLEVEKQIQENGHLENIPSACEVQENGIEVGEMNRLLLEKVEELTLYTIDQQKQLDQQTKEIEELKALVNTLVQKNK